MKIDVTTTDLAVVSSYVEDGKELNVLIIYYQNRGAGASVIKDPLKKEIIGGYVLFPGNGDKGAIEVAPFMQARNEVNIGAFPLRPGNDANNEILRDFLDGLLNKSAWVKHLEEVIAQKGMIQVLESEKELSADFIVTPFSKTPEDVARWIYKHNAVVVRGKDLPNGRDPYKVRLISIEWMPPVSMIVGKGGYIGQMTNDDIINTFGSCPYAHRDTFHVWRGVLTNCRLWKDKFGSESDSQ